MKYQSKKDPTITAAYDFQDPKTKTIRMIYLTGEKAGYSFEISSSTLKRWWQKLDVPKEEVDDEIINTPYHPDVTPHYIPKPESVVEYENMRSRSNNELPDFDGLVEDFESFSQKINQNSKYIKLLNSQTTIWRKSAGIDVYADEIMWERFVEQGLKSTPNKDKNRPFAIKIKSADDYEKLKKAIID